MSKKGENIYKRKDNRWEARYIKGYREDGSVQYGYCYGKTYRDAKQKVTTAKTALLTGKQASDQKKDRLSFYLDEWLYLNRHRVKESTFVKYGNIIEKHIRPALGKCLVQSISSVTVEKFSRHLLESEELAPKTVKDILILLHSILSYTAKSYPEVIARIEINYPKESRKEMRVLTAEEQTRFVEYLLESTDECKFGVLLALLTGMRIGEVCALRWGDISLKDKVVKISSTMQRLKNLDGGDERTRVVISEPKSDRSARIIPLTENAVRLCERFRQKDPEAFLLTGSSQSYVEPRRLQYCLKRYTEECGLDGVHFHVLRHTFATRCVEVGFEIKSLSEILGHASPKITLERYVHSSMELKRDNMKKLAAIGF